MNLKILSELLGLSQMIYAAPNAGAPPQGRGWLLNIGAAGARRAGCYLPS